MEKYSLQIAGREIPLRFSMRELADIEEAIGTADKLKELILQGRRRLRNLVSTIRIMGNSGLRHAGQPEDLTDEWLLDHMDPAMITGYQIAVLGAFTDGFHMETEEDTVRDPVLEEIEKKKG